MVRASPRGEGKGTPLKRKSIHKILEGLTTLREVEKKGVVRNRYNTRNYFNFCDQCGGEIKGKMAWTGACYKCRKAAVGDE